MTTIPDDVYLCPEDTADTEEPAYLYRDVPSIPIEVYLHSNRPLRIGDAFEWKDTRWCLGEHDGATWICIEVGGGA